MIATLQGDLFKIYQKRKIKQALTTHRKQCQMITTV